MNRFLLTVSSGRPARICLTRWVLLVASCVAAFAQPLRAADVRDLVGADVGICIEVRNLSEVARALEGESFAKRIQATSFYAEWLQGEEYGRLRGGLRALQKLTGQTLGDFVDGLFGRHAIIAIYARNGASPAGILLTEASDRQSLDHVISVWNAADTAQLESRTEAGAKYIVRRSKSETLYYAVLGSQLVLSDQEILVRDAVRRHSRLARNQPVESVLSSDLYRSAQRSLSENCFATVFVNPRVWTSLLGIGRRRSNLVIAATWSQLSWVASGLRLENGITWEVTTGFESALGTILETWIKHDEIDEFLAVTPATALFVVTGQVDIQSAAKFVAGEFERRSPGLWFPLREAARGLLLGHDLFDDIIPEFGSRFGGYVNAQQDRTGRGLAIEGIVAWRFPRAQTSPSTTEAAIRNALSTAWNLAAAAYNEDRRARTRVEEQSANGYRITFVRNFWMTDPAFTVARGFLAVGSTPEALQALCRLTADKSLLAEATFRRCRESAFPEAQTVAYVNLVAVRDYLTQNRDYFVDQSIQDRGENKGTATQRLNRLREVLGIGDAAFLAFDVNSATGRLVLGFSAID